MKFLKIVLLCLLCTVTVPLSAEDRITLKEAIEYALHNKAESKKAMLDIENSEYQIRQAKSGIYPALNASANLGYSPILQETAIPGEMFGQPGEVVMASFGQKWNSSLGVSLSQNIFNQAVFTGLKAARTTREFYQINAQLTDEQVIERVATAYYNVFIQKEQLAIINSSYATTQKVRDIIKNLLDNGLARRIDLDRTEVQLTNIGSTRQQLINAVQIQENALKFYMGMPVAQPIELAEEDFEIRPALLENEIAVENLTALRVLKKQEELLILQKEAAKARYYPILSLSANYNYAGQSNVFPIGKGKSDGVYWSDYSAIGLSLQIPVFNGFSIKSTVSQSEISIKKLQEDINDTRLGLELEYQNAKSQIENNLATIESQKENVALAQKVLDDTQNNYMQGLANLTDLLNAQDSLVQAKNNLSNAILQYKLAEIQLLKSKGELNTLVQK
ncbi:MAG: TolC family protein [Flavobacteriaceae bacterium]|jgi:outer membrane protein TolC|nr:TolC family protein [Flavobacteriaceae bacterium]